MEFFQSGLEMQSLKNFMYRKILEEKKRIYIKNSQNIKLTSK